MKGRTGRARGARGAITLWPLDTIVIIMTMKPITYATNNDRNSGLKIIPFFSRCRLFVQRKAAAWKAGERENGETITNYA
jgi:hypothetical protein